MSDKVAVDNYKNIEKFIRFHFSDDENDRFHSYIAVVNKPQKWISFPAEYKHYREAPEEKRIILDFFPGNYEKKRLLQEGVRIEKCPEMNQIGYLNTRDPIKSLQTFYSFQRHSDYYLSANGFCKKKSRKADDLFRAMNIVIDLDLHDEYMDQKEKESLIHIAGEELYSHTFCHMPCPNTIVYTGRGIQLWWKVRPFSIKKLRYVYDDMKNYLMDELEALFTSLPYFENKFILDRAASRNASGLFRLPCTWNTKSYSYGSIHFLHQDETDCLQHYFARHPLSGKKYKKYKKAKNDTAYYYRKPGAYGDMIKNKIRRLIQVRKENHISERGFRDLYLFVVCCAYASSKATEEETLQATFEINELFDCPMSETEIMRTMKSALTRKYKLSYGTIIEKLSISKREQKLLKISKNPRKTRTEMQNNGKRLRKERKIRNEKILRMHQDGMTQKAIALAVGLTQSAISKILAKAKSELSEQAKTKKIQTRPCSEKETSKNKESFSGKCIIRPKKEQKNSEQHQIIKEHSYKHVYFSGIDPGGG